MLMKKLYSLFALLLACVSVQAQNWTVPTESYNNYMVVYAQLQTNLPTDIDVRIGAFIDDQCRAIIDPQRKDTDGSKVYAEGTTNAVYVIVVPGNANVSATNTSIVSDQGKAITFKAWDPTTGYEYSLTTPAITFAGDGTYGDPPSNPTLVLTLNTATGFEINNFQIEAGQNCNLRSKVKTTPEGCAIPDNVKWSLSVTGAEATFNIGDYAYITDSILYAKKGYQGLITVSMEYESLATTGPQVLASGNFSIIEHATAINLLKQDTIVVNKPTDPTDNAALFAALQTYYSVNPASSTDTIHWETKDASIIEVTETDNLLLKSGGITQIRPYINQVGGGKLVPASDAWITVKIFVPVTSINVNLGVFDGSFKANVGDTHLYERIAKMITVLPADATDKTYTVSLFDSATGVLDLTSGNNSVSINAVGEGTTTIKLKANGAEATNAVENQVDVIVEKPATQVDFYQNLIYVHLDSGAPQDITDKVKANLKPLNGIPSADCTVSVSGTGVTANEAGINTSGIIGNFTANAVGTATVTIDLKWPDYDAWGVTSETLTNKSYQASFQIEVQDYVALASFNVAVTDAVAGQTGTITLTPKPDGATFDVNKITIVLDNGFVDDPNDDNDWADQLAIGIINETTSELKYSFMSTIPCKVNVEAWLESDDPTATATATRIPINDPTSTKPNDFKSFEIGNPLNLNAGWQWITNTVGAIPKDSLVSTFSTTDLIEIRTSSALLYNDPSWGYYGTLMKTDGLKQWQCYKVNMKNKREIVLYGSSATDALIDGAINGDGSCTFTLQPGWNWIGSPYLFDRQLSTVFAANNADLEGAIIIGKTGSAELSGGVWKGDDKMMKAGQGYVIMNPKTEVLNVTLAAESAMLPGNDATSSGVKGEFTAHVWEYDHTRFMNNMTIVARLMDVEHPEQYSIGAFVGDECRGEGIIEDGKAFITVHCDAGEFVTFKLYSPYTGEFYPIEEGLQAQTRVGSLKSPFRMHASNVVDGINGISDSNANAESFDLSGRRISNQQRGIILRRNADGKMHKVIKK